MLGVLLALLSALFFGVLFVVTRLGLQRAPHPVAGAFVTDVVALAASAAVAGAVDAHGFAGVRFADLWPYLAAGALAPGLSQALFVLAVRNAGPSRASVVMGATPLVSALAAIVLLGEPARAWLLLGTALVVAGAVSLGWDRSRPVGFRATGIVFACGCVLLFASRDQLVRWAASDAKVHPLPAATAVLAAASATTLAYLAFTERRRLPALVTRAALPFVPAGLTIGFAYDALTEAFARTRVGVVAPLNATQAIWGVGLSVVVLGRSEMVSRRLVAAAALIVAGAAVIGVAHG